MKDSTKLLLTIFLIIILLALAFTIPFFLKIFEFYTAPGEECNWEKYSKCETGEFKCLENGAVCEGSIKEGTTLIYKNENYCNGDYYPDCSKAKYFSCGEEVSCKYNVSLCASVNMVACNSDCWEKCETGKFFCKRDGAVCVQ